MKNFLLALIVGTSCGSVLVAQVDKSKPVTTIEDPPPPAVEYNAKAWQEFSSQEGRFSITFPGVPVARTRTIQTSAGEVVDHTVIVKLPESYYHVNYLDYPTYTDTEEFAARTLQAGRDGMLASTKGMELLREQEIIQNGFKGREYLILMDKFSFGITRVFFVHGRLYELGLLVPADVAFKNGRPSVLTTDRTEFFNSLTSRFFDSFRLLESSDPKSSAVADEPPDFDRAVDGLVTRCPGAQTLVAAADGDSKHLNTGGVLNGKAVHLATPPYPSIARSSHAAGQVRVQVIIDCEGNVAAARAIDGHPLLRGAAEKAARESKFTPTTLAGKVVNVNGIIIYNFVAQ